MFPSYVGTLGSASYGKVSNCEIFWVGFSSHWHSGRLMFDSIKRGWQILDKGYQRLAAMEYKKLSFISVIFFLLYYGVTGFGKTIIADFKLSQELQEELKGLDTNTLLTHLLIELEEIRSIHDRAQRLEINLVRDLQSFRLANADFNVSLSTQANANYKQLIQDVGALQWGPVQVPAEVVLRPFQWLIGQRIIAIDLYRLGGRHFVAAHSDRGNSWVSREEDLTVFGPQQGGNLLMPARLLTALAYKLTFKEGQDYEPAEIWQGLYKAHQGLKCLIESERIRRTAPERAQEWAGKAISEFEGALALNPEDDKAFHNLILALIEQASYAPPLSAIPQYENIARKLRVLDTFKTSDPTTNRTLWIATYALLGEAHGRAGQYRKAVPVYLRALALSKKNADLQAVLQNNLGLAYEELKKPVEAAHAFRQAIARRSTYVHARVNLGKLLFHQMRDPAASERETREALRIRPNAFRASNNLGILYREVLKNTEEFSSVNDGSKSCMLMQGLLLATQAFKELEKKRLMRDLDENEQQDLDAAQSLQFTFLELGASFPQDKESIPRKLCLSKAT